LSERVKPPAALPDAEFEDDAFVIVSESGRTRAIVKVTGSYRYFTTDARGHIIPLKEIIEPTASTEIRGME
jgi:hypothetical protein